MLQMMEHLEMGGKKCQNSFWGLNDQNLLFTSLVAVVMQTWPQSKRALNPSRSSELKMCSGTIMKEL